MLSITLIFTSIDVFREIFVVCDNCTKGIIILNEVIDKNNNASLK